MKRLVVVLALVSPIPSNAIEVPDKCENITRRTYFISRLERTVQVLKKINLGSRIIEIDPTFFIHHDILSTIMLINEKQNLEPMFDLWEKLKEYKQIDDFLIMQEFTKLILVLPGHLLKPPEKSIAAIKADIKLSLEGTSYIEAVTLRRYYNERLKKAITFLSRIPCAKKEFFEAAKPGCDCSFITNYEFHHPEIKRIIQEMNRENNLIPVIGLVQDFEKLKLIHDPDYQKQFMILIFTIYRNLLINNAAKYEYPIKKNTAEVIVYLYENIEKIPLEQILDAIDLLAEELPAILEKYEFKKNMTWQECKEWLKKYWWVSSIALGALTFKLLRIFYPPKKPKSSRPAAANNATIVNRPTSTSLLEEELP